MELAKLKSCFIAVALMVVGASPMDLARARPLPSLHPKPPQSAGESFLKVMKTPTILLLREFRGICRSGNSTIDIEHDQASLERLLDAKKRVDAIRIRTLIVAGANCSNGASREAILRTLGVDLLVRQTTPLIRALYQEQADAAFLELLVGAEAAEFAEATCVETSCQERRKKVWSAKKQALESVKIRKREEKVRRQLLKYLASH